MLESLLMEQITKISTKHVLKLANVFQDYYVIQLLKFARFQKVKFAKLQGNVRQDLNALEEYAKPKQ